MSDPASAALARTDFYREVRANQWRTVGILAPMVVTIVVVGAAVVLAVGLGIVGVVAVLILAALVALAAYRASESVALAAARARPADPDEYPRYHNLVEGLCIAAGLPKPRLFVVDDPAPNAFATGRNPKHAALAATTGALDQLSQVELEGVIANELSHVKNYDVLASTVAVTALGAPVLLADLRDAGGAGGVLAVIGLPLLVFTPLAAKLMRTFLSGDREILADATGVQLTRYPPGLASALKKLEADRGVVRAANRATAQLWIESPLDRDDAAASRRNRAFETHPPLEERIRILESM